MAHSDERPGMAPGSDVHCPSSEMVRFVAEFQGRMVAVETLLGQKATMHDIDAAVQPVRQDIASLRQETTLQTRETRTQFEALTGRLNEVCTLAKDLLQDKALRNEQTHRDEKSELERERDALKRQVLDLEIARVESRPLNRFVKVWVPVVAGATMLVSFSQQLHDVATAFLRHLVGK